MILTNRQMFDSLTILSKVEEKGMLGYAIARNRQKLLAELQEYSKMRDDLLKEHGSDVGNGNFELSPEAAAKFFGALKPYDELEVDVPIMQVTPEIFCSGNLTSSMMFTLDWMVKEDC